MEKLIFFEPGFDERDPDPRKDYGIGGVKIRFVLKDERGAVQFLIITDWYPYEVQKEHFDNGTGRFSGKYNFFDPKPMGADVGYHSPTPMYEEHCRYDCDLLDQGYCYYDGSGLFAQKLVRRFLVEGEDIVWEELESYHKQMFGEELL